MAETMLALGDFRFAIDTAAFNELRMRLAFTWAEQATVGTSPKQQFTGREAVTVSLKGVIYPHFLGGMNQVDKMAALAAQGKPLLLTDGLGKVWGRFVITSIEEVRSVLFANGLPRKQDFSIDLKYYDNGRV